MNLLERTRRLLQGLTPPSPPKIQYYSVACPEGHRLRGERTEGYQALRCPTCGEGIFILPRSPLPEPISPESTREGRAAPLPADSERDGDQPVGLADPPSRAEPEARDSTVDGEIQWIDQTPEDTETEAGASRAPAGTVERSDFFDSLSVPDESPSTLPAQEPRSKRKRPATRQAPRVASVRESDQLLVAPRFSLVGWAKRRRNPLIFLGVILIVAGTVGYRVWRSKLQDLPRIVEIGREQGLAALDAGDFDTAHQLLSAARRAVDTLGGAVEGAAEIRQGADEAAIYTTLTPELLERILVEASADQIEWSARFDTHYKGRSILLDAVVEEAPDASGAGAYDLDYRILPNGEGNRPNLRVGRIDLTGFQLFEQSQPKPGDHVQFGARLASFTHDRENKVWLVGLEPESGVFLTHAKALEAIGRPSADETAGGDGAR